MDLGFFRMSEDADLVLPGPASRQRLTNVRRMHRVRDVLKEIGPVAGVSARFPAGELFEKATHGMWQLDYPSEFGPQGLRLEVSIRTILRPAREVHLRQLLDDPLAGNVSTAKCFALDADEARAEKVRAAFTREAVRDFYDWRGFTSGRPTWRRKNSSNSSTRSLPSSVRRRWRSRRSPSGSPKSAGAR